MAVLKEYRCDTCNRIFDSTVSVCIHCGSLSVTRVFITPFAIKGDVTKHNDKTIQHLTAAHGMTDYSNNESTRHDRKSVGSWIDPKQAVSLANGERGINVEASGIDPLAGSINKMRYSGGVDQGGVA